jgi:hypothetical protein
MLAADMDIAEATGASLIAVLAFGLSAATSYAWSGLVDWPIAALLIAGGMAGAVAGTRLNGWLGNRRGALGRLFAAFLMLAGVYVSARGALELFS